MTTGGYHTVSSWLLQS